MKIILLAIMFFGAYSVPCAVAQNNLEDQYIRDTVSKYCEMNLKGMLLDAAGRSKADVYVPTSYMPVITRITLVTDYDIEYIKVDHKTARADVEYTAIAFVNDQFQFQASTYNDHGKLKLNPTLIQIEIPLRRDREDSHDWKIDPNNFESFVNSETLISYLEKARTQDPSPHLRKNAQKSLALLRTYVKAK